jgi:hypothetical protein
VTVSAEWEAFSTDMVAVFAVGTENAFGENEFENGTEERETGCCRDISRIQKPYVHILTRDNSNIDFH